MTTATVIRVRARPKPVREESVPAPAESGVFPVERPRGWDERTLRAEVLGEFRRLGRVDYGDAMTEAVARWDGTKNGTDEGGTT